MKEYNVISDDGIRIDFDDGYWMYTLDFKRKFISPNLYSSVRDKHTKQIKLIPFEELNDQLNTNEYFWEE